LWTVWSVEVRVLSGALEKPRMRGFFRALAGDATSVLVWGAVVT
jgi:hypothetical protein